MDLRDPVLERGALELIFDFAIPQGAFKGDELPLLERLGELREIPPGKDAIGRKVALTNQLRGFLLERGLPVRVGSEYLRKALPSILEDAENGLTPRARTILSTLREEWIELETRIETVTEEIGRIS